MTQRESRLQAAIVRDGEILVLEMSMTWQAWTVAIHREWSPLQRRVLSSIIELAKPPTALCQETRNPGLKFTSRSGALITYGPEYKSSRRETLRMAACDVSVSGKPASPV